MAININNIHNSDDKNILQDILNVLASSPTGTNAPFEDLFNTDVKNLLYAILLALQAGGTGGGGGTAGWALTGNAAATGNFLGTTNEQPLILRQNGGNVMTFAPSAVAGNIVEAVLGDDWAHLKLGPTTLVPDSNNAIISGSEIQIKSGEGINIDSTTTGSVTSEQELVFSAPRIIAEVDVADGNGFFLDGIKDATPTAELLALEVAPNGGEVVNTKLTVAGLVTTVQEAVAGNYWALGGNNGPGDGEAMTFGANTTNDVKIKVGAGEVMRITKTRSVGIRTESPNSNLDVFGSFGARLIKPALIPDGTFTVDESADGALTYVIDYDDVADAEFMLPDPANVEGRLYIVKRTLVNGGGAVILGASGTANGMERSDGVMVTTLALDIGQVYWYQSDGTSYLLLFNR